MDNLEKVKEDGRYLAKIEDKDQTFEICCEAVKENIEAVKHVREDLLNNELFIIIMQNHTWALDHDFIRDKLNQLNIDNYAICYEAIRKNPMQLYLVDLIDENIQDEAMGRLAIEQDHDSMPYVNKKNRSLELCMYFLNTYKYGLRFFPIDLITEDICWTALKYNCRQITKVPGKFITEKMGLFVLEKDHDIIHFMITNFWTEKMIWYVINSGGNLSTITDKKSESLITEDMWRAIGSKNISSYLLSRIPEKYRDKAMLKANMELKNNSNSSSDTIMKNFQHLDFTEEEYLEIIKKHPLEIVNIENQTEEMQFEAIKRGYQNIARFEHTFAKLKNPSQDIILYTINKYGKLYLLEKLDKKYWSYELLLNVVRSDPNAIEIIPKEIFTSLLSPDEAENICLETCKANLSYWIWCVLDKIPKQYLTEKVWTILLKTRGSLIANCDKQIKHLAEIAVKSDPEALDHIRTDLITEELVNLAVLSHDKYGYKALQYARKYKTKELCNKAFKKNIYAIKFFKKEWITPDMRKEAFEKEKLVIVDYPDEYVTYEMIKTVTDEYGPSFLSKSQKKRVTYDMYVSWINNYMDKLEKPFFGNGVLVYIVEQIKGEDCKERVKGQLLSGKFKKSLWYLDRTGLKYFKSN